MFLVPEQAPCCLTVLGLMSWGSKNKKLDESESPTQPGKCFLPRTAEQRVELPLRIRPPAAGYFGPCSRGSPRPGGSNLLRELGRVQLG